MYDLLAEKDISNYVDKLIRVTMSTSPVVIRERVRSEIEYTASVGNARLKFSEGNKSVKMWIMLDDSKNISVSYMLEREHPSKVTLQVDNSGFRILDVRDSKGEIGVNTSNLLNTIKFQADVLAANEILELMSELKGDK
jgi:hypothetical protein